VDIGEIMRYRIPKNQIHYSVIDNTIQAVIVFPDNPELPKAWIRTELPISQEDLGNLITSRITDHLAENIIVTEKINTAISDFSTLVDVDLTYTA